jgi:hypothetical protein
MKFVIYRVVRHHLHRWKILLYIEHLHLIIRRIMSQRIRRLINV